MTQRATEQIEERPQDETVVDKDDLLDRPSRSVQRRERRSQVVRVLTEYGFVDLLVQSGLWQHASPSLKVRRSDLAALGSLSSAQRLRLALEQLGGGFFKLGQSLSVRPDLVPADYVVELEKLQDNVAPLPFETIRQVIEAEFDCSLTEIFASFSETPLGSASIGQVHEATLFDGTEVVVKVQRPEAATLVNLDLDSMTYAARRMSGSPWAGDVDLVGIVNEFAEAVRNELDFTAEARSLDRFCEFFANSPEVQIPRAYWDYTTNHVLTMSRLDGIPLSQPQRIKEGGGDITQLIGNGVNAYMRMVFELQEFHSDPHPGNLLALDDDSIGFVDFGRVSKLSGRGLDRVADCFIAYMHNDASALTEAVLELTRADESTDREALLHDLEDVMDRYSGAELADASGPAALSETLKIVREHRLHMPSQYAMLFQTLGVLQGVVLRLDPTIRLLEVMEPYVKEVVRQRYTPERLGREVLGQIRRYGRMAARVPGAMDSVLRRLTAGELGVGIKVDVAEETLDRAEVMANRFSLTLLVSAMAIALALVGGQAVPGWMSSATHALLLLVFAVGVGHFVSIVAAERRSKRRKHGRA